MRLQALLECGASILDTMIAMMDEPGGWTLNGDGTAEG
jgi:hypothetical protein